MDTSDEDDDDSLLRKRPARSQSSNSSNTRPATTGDSHGRGVALQDEGVVSQASSAAQLVSYLHRAGHVEELQWLEAYLLDEARDRTMMVSEYSLLSYKYLV